MKSKIDVDAGICGFQTVVEASSDDGQFVTFSIQSDCEKIRAVGKKLSEKGPVDAYGEIGAGDEGVLMQTAHSILKGCCAGCVVPSAIFKGMQVAACVALPKDIHITMQKE